MKSIYIALVMSVFLALAMFNPVYSPKSNFHKELSVKQEYVYPYQLYFPLVRQPYSNMQWENDDN